VNARAVKFLVVGIAGCAVQITTLASLTSGLGVHWIVGTVTAVEIAILHNFCWHLRWTWRDRPGTSWLSQLGRFHASTAFMSIGGNLAAMSVLVRSCGMEPIPANALAVALVSVANFVIADRWVFRPRHVETAVVLVLALSIPATAAPPAHALRAWCDAVATVEANTAPPLAVWPQPPDGIAAEGESTAVEDGTISRWRGAVFIPGVRLEQLLDRLQHPGTPPPQADVIAARVLSRAPDSLRVYMRLVRRAIVTVTYDTEHEMTFHRESPALATARSVATRIEEVGGGDTGFLWKLNSYWRYHEQPDGVLVSVETLTLSRDVPLLVKPIARPIIQRVARESMIRTLTALRTYAQRTR
jgi:putative flippase GtrA